GKDRCLMYLGRADVLCPAARQKSARTGHECWLSSLEWHRRTGGKRDVLDGRPGRSPLCAMLDWDALREALQTALLEAVSAEVGGPWRAAALDGLYAETDGVITAPSLYLNDDGEDMNSPPDWKTGLHDWAPAPWIDALTAEACSGTVSHWKDIFRRYQDVLVHICVATGAHLGIPVFFVDHCCYDEMLARCLTPSQLRSLFPKVVATQAERARVSALPRGEQIAYYISRLDRF